MQSLPLQMEVSKWGCIKRGRVLHERESKRGRVGVRVYVRVCVCVCVSWFSCVKE